MKHLAIQAEQLGKEYAIAQATNRHPTLRDFLGQMLTSPLQRLGHVLRGRGAHTKQETFWALKDVTFEVERGTVVGVIGRNGAGKSTLLKILSRITDPSEGWASLHGRVGSLLEVGTGFHPDLSGRDNIFLNGAMIGMRRREIRERFDAIVEFSEIGKFLDTPVKHYSSGMYMRLAFAVAAHLEPEIFIIDEALAVGDPGFQKKCLAKMEAVSRNGSTVLVVSHALPIIQAKCQLCVWLDKGRMIKAGKADDIVTDYAKSVASLRDMALVDRPDRGGDGSIRFQRVELLDARGQQTGSFLTGEPATFVVHVVNTSGQDLRNVDFSLGVDDASSMRLTLLSSHVIDQACDRLGPGEHTVIFKIPRWPLAQGRYSYSLGCRVNEVVADAVQNVGSIDVEAGDFYGCGKPVDSQHGVFYVDFAVAVDQDARLRNVA